MISRVDRVERAERTEMFKKRKEKKEKAIIDRYYDLLVNKKPKFIKTDSSYERFFLYKALEKYSKDNEIWSQRKKEYIKSSSYFCKEHKCKLKTIDCNNGIDEFFYECKRCEDYLDPLDTEDLLSPKEHCYKVKKIIGLTIFYENPNIPKIQHFTK